MKRLRNLLHWIVHSWQVQIAGSLILLVTTFYGYQTSLHHGLRGIVILHAIGTIPNIIQAFESAEKGINKGED